MLVFRFSLELKLNKFTRLITMRWNYVSYTRNGQKLTKMSKTLQPIVVSGLQDSSFREDIGKHEINFEKNCFCLNKI